MVPHRARSGASQKAFRTRVSPTAPVEVPGHNGRRRGLNSQAAVTSQFEVQPQCLVKLGKLSWRDSADPAAQPPCPNGSDLLGLRL